jgi:uncharacterized protein with PhoU and TrkA domain
MPDWFLSRLNLAHPTNLLLSSYMAAIAVGTLALVPGADFTVKDSDILIILGRESDPAKIKELK